VKTNNLRHTGIVVSNIEKSLEFYRDLLGFIVVKDQVETGRYIDIFLGLEDVTVRTVKMCLGEGSMLELLCFFSHPPKMTPQKIYDLGCSHVALTVEDLDETYKSLLNSGVFFNNPPQISPDGYAKVAFCQDPDGSYLELVEELQ
jgi:lactoylglutathione lyase